MVVYTILSKIAYTSMQVACVCVCVCGLVNNKKDYKQRLWRCFFVVVVVVVENDDRMVPLRITI